MVSLGKFFLYTYPLALIASAGSIYFFTQPIEYPSIHLGPIFAYLIAFFIQLIWLLFIFSNNAWRHSGVGKAIITVNVLSIIFSAIGVLMYFINGEVYGINIDLVLGPIVAFFVAVALILLLLVKGMVHHPRA